MPTGHSRPRPGVDEAEHEAALVHGRPGRYQGILTRMEPLWLTLRHTVMWARTALLAALVAGLTACTGGGSVGAPSTPTSGSTVMKSPSTDAVVSTLMGYPQQSARCPTEPTTEPEQTPVVVTGKPIAYLICPLQGGVWGPPFSPYRLTKSAPGGGEPFAGLDAALRLPDESAAEVDDSGVDQVCPASLQAPRTIFVETSDGLWQAHVPSGSCGAYLPQVVDALSKIVIPL